MSFKSKTTVQKGKILSRILPLTTWGLAVTGVIALYVHRTTSFHVVGVAMPQTRAISSSESGLLLSLPMQLYQEVKQGQTLAVLRTNTAAENEYARQLLDARKATARKELDRLTAELQAAEQKLRESASQQASDLTYHENQYSLDVERIRLKVLELETTLEPEKIQLQDLTLEKKVLQELLDKKAIEPYELQKTEVQYQVLTEKIRLQEQWLAQAKEDMAQAQIRRDEFLAQQPEPAQVQILLEPLRRAIDTQKSRLAELILPSTEVVITAPFDGIVTDVAYCEGQAVLSGETIVSITAARPEYVQVWLNQNVCGNIRQDQEVQVIKTTSPRQILRSTISQVSPMIELVPTRLWRNPSVPEWGRPVIIPISPDMQLLPNELVGVREI